MGLFSFGGNTQQDADDEQTPVRPRRSRAPEEEPMDPMLPEKKRARRRLIGATALVLAAVIGLPMIFDSEPRPISQDITIQIPPRDKAPPMNASPMPLPPGPTASTEPAGANAAASANPASVPAKAEAKQADNIPAASETDATAKDKAATVAVGEKRVDSLVDKPSASPSEATRSADKDKSRYIVQVAAVSNKAKVDELLQKLKRGGIEGYWQKVSTKEGERFRVRVGPFSSREEAEKMSKRIDKLGLPGTVQAI